jgi:hypothetical protein
MVQKEPVKITLSGTFRWVFGLFFLVIAAGMVTSMESQEKKKILFL